MVAHRWGALSKLHAFPRPEDHLTQKTLSGAVVTLLGVLTMAVLFAHELSFMLTPDVKHQMSVDATPRGQKLDIYLNISFPALPCNVVSLDALDMSGNHEVDITTNVYKIRLDRDGRMIEPDAWLLRDGLQGIKPKVKGKGNPLHQRQTHNHAHHIPHKPIDTDKDKDTDTDKDTDKDRDGVVASSTGDGSMDLIAEMEQMMMGLEETVRQVKQAMERGEGCRLYGHLTVERVAGNFHVSVHGQSYMVLQQVYSSVGEVNVSHVIHSLGFGAPFPGRVNPLDRFVRMLPPAKEGEDPARASGTFKYFLKVVPTEFHFWHGGKVKTNQYSISEYFSPSVPQANALPAVYFLYDLSPIAVTITESTRSFFHFLTRLCAVLGGTFALTGMLDRWVYGFLQLVAKPRSSPMKKARH